MTVNRAATKAGKQYERDLMAYLRECSFDVERLRLAGAEDEGDHCLRAPRGDRYIIEAKREKGFNLAGWIKEAELEANNYMKHRGLIAPPGFLVVHHARGKGIGKSYVATTLDEFLSWIS